MRATAWLGLGVGGLGVASPVYALAARIFGGAWVSGGAGLAIVVLVLE